MAMLKSLRDQGWFVTSEGLHKLSENGLDFKTITRNALDIDIRDFGSPVLATELTKCVFGPAVVQISKIRNISAPKNKPHSQTAPPLIKLTLTDGHTICQAIDIESIPTLNVDKTVPGTKLYINGAKIASGYLLLSPNNCKILGGNVKALVEKWQLSKLMPTHNRITNDGPPAWVNFGTKIITGNINETGAKSKEITKEDLEFQAQRKDAIAEAAQGVVKKFGGGIKTINFNDDNTQQRSQQKRSFQRKSREKPEVVKTEKPSQKVSLFDFLEEKLPANENKSKTSLEMYQNRRADRFEKQFDFKSEGVNERKSQGNFGSNESQMENKYQSGRPPRLQKPFNTKPFNTKPKPVTEPKPQSNFDSNESQTIQMEKRQQTLPPRLQNSKPLTESKSKSSLESSELPPRLQKQTDASPRPNTVNFVNKLTSEINNLTLYNEKIQKRSPHTNTNHVVDESATSETWKWNEGDRCMAKYWEDNKYYNAVVTGVTNRTCMVEFIDYGNFEEVLHCDCIPLTTEQQDNKHFHYDNQHFKSNMECRRDGKKQPITSPSSSSSSSSSYYKTSYYSRKNRNQHAS